MAARTQSPQWRLCQQLITDMELAERAWRLSCMYHYDRACPRPCRPRTPASAHGMLHLWQFPVSHKSNCSSQTGSCTITVFPLRTASGRLAEQRPRTEHCQKLHAAYDANGHMVPVFLYRNPHTVGTGTWPTAAARARITHEKGRGRCLILHAPLRGSVIINNFFGFLAGNLSWSPALPASFCTSYEPWPENILFLCTSHAGKLFL